MRSSPCLLLLAVALLLGMQPRTVSAMEPPGHLVHDLHVRLDPATATLHGRDSFLLDGPPAPSLELLVSPRVTVERATVDGQSVSPERLAHGWSLPLPPRPRDGAVPVVVEFSGRFADPLPTAPDNFDNPGFGVSATIGPQRAFLLAGSRWHPLVVGRDNRFDLTVRAPKGLGAVSEGHWLGQDNDGQETVSRWRATAASDGLFLFAGPYQVHSTAEAGPLVATFLFADNADLADRYLAAASRHVAAYACQFGPYPFPQFAVVENFFPTGYGFPGATLLGGQVLRLPFIPATSLRHEVAHCWWGNGVYVDPRQGNWSEGLTTYVADHQAAEEAGPAEARHYRRQILFDYAQLAAGPADFPLTQFTSRTDPATRTIGYGKAAYLFHMIRRQVGDAAFRQGLRQVFARRLFQPTTWDDFRQAFVDAGWNEAVSRRFLAQWLERPGAPGLRLENVTTVQDGLLWRVRGRIIQTDPIYHLRLPLELRGATAQVRQEVEVNATATPFELSLPEPPRRLEADPEADLFLRLPVEAVPASVNSLKGSPRLVAVVADGLASAHQAALRSLLAGLGQPQATVLSEAAWAARPDSAADVLVFGPPRTAAVQALLGDGHGPWRPDSFVATPGCPQADSLWTVHNDPVQPGRSLAALVWRGCATPEAVAAAARKITHYGRYALLAFRDGNNVAKEAGEATTSPLVKVWP